MSLFRLSDVGVKFDTSTGPIYPLRHINVSFPYSGLIAIKGKSGSGKSTLLNVISSLLKPSEGKVFFQGRAISSWNEKKLSLWRLHHIGIVFQHYNLIDDMSVLENVMLPSLMAGKKKKSAQTKAEILLKMVGLSEYSKKNVSLLSGGERQRTAIARALSNDPEIIIADEPTGALDSENGEMVMSLLKEISKTKLVIYVSHNEEMILKNSDYIYELEEGRLLSKKRSEEENKIEDDISLRNVKRSSWVSSFTSRHFRHNKLKNSICFISGLIGYSSLLLSLGFYLGSAKCIEKEQTCSLEYMTSTVSEKTYIEIENSPLRMVRRKRPSLTSALDAVEGIDGVAVEPDYSFFLPQYSSFKLNGAKQEGSSFFPVYETTLDGYGDDFLIEGKSFSGNNINEALVNEEFVKAFGPCLEKEIALDIAYSFSWKGTQIEGHVPFLFKIRGVVSEFSFLNSPKAYYSYIGLDALLANTLIDETMSLKDVVVGGDDKETFTGLDYFVFAKKPKYVPLIHKRINDLKEKGSFISIESTCYDIKNAFTSLTEAFSMALIVFVGVAIIGISVIEGMIAYSNFINQKKEAAVLLSLGANKEQINSIFVNESVTVSLISGVVSFCLSPLLQMAVNRFISERFSLRNLIDIPYSSFFNVPAFLFVVISLFSMLVAFIGTSIAVSSVRTKSLCQELKDE